MSHKMQKSSIVIISILLLIILGLVYLLYMSKENPVVEKDMSSATAYSSASVSVANALPVASGVSLNSGSSITLYPNPATTSVSVGATITDANGCNDIASVDIAVYKNGTTCTSVANANDDTCYFATVASSSADISGCSGGSDTSSVLSHTFDFKSFADPGTWTANITPTDIEATGISASSSVALNETLALDVTSSLNYGAVAGGSSSVGDHTITTTDLGNVAIDFDLIGSDLICNGGVNPQGSIPTGNLQYDLASFTYGNGTALSSTTQTAVNANLATTSVASPTTSADTYWQVAVPSGVRGICSGQITFSAISAL